MAPLRSTSFYKGTPPVVGGVNTWTTVYTVAVGFRIVLKDVYMVNNGGVGHSGGVRLNAASIVRQRLLNPLGSAGDTDDTKPWIVLNPAETLQVLQVPAGVIYYALSGYLLYI